MNTTAKLAQAHPEENQWDLIIQPQRSLFDLHMGDLWRYRDLVMLFVRRDFVSVYKQTILGPLWYLIQPLLTTLTFTVIFGQYRPTAHRGPAAVPLLHVQARHLDYFAECLTKTSNTFVQNAHLFGKVYFRAWRCRFSILFSNLITLRHPVCLLPGLHGLLALSGRRFAPTCGSSSLPSWC
jgi:lipopolysaccharide transport system permease protein